MTCSDKEQKPHKRHEHVGKSVIVPDTCPGTEVQDKVLPQGWSIHRRDNDVHEFWVARRKLAVSVFLVAPPYLQFSKAEFTQKPALDDMMVDGMVDGLSHRGTGGVMVRPPPIVASTNFEAFACNLFDRETIGKRHGVRPLEPVIY